MKIRKKFIFAGLNLDVRELVIPTKKQIDGKSPREFVFDLVSKQAGIPKDRISDQTELGNQWHNVVTWATILSQKILVGSAEMTAGDLVRQLEA